MCTVGVSNVYGWVGKSVRLGQVRGSIRVSQRHFGAFRGFAWVIRWKSPCGSSWKTRSVFQGAVGAFCASTVPSASTGPVRVRQDDSQGRGWTAPSSDCCRPVNHYVRLKTADLYRPNARFIPERQRYQVFMPFWKLGYSQVRDPVGDSEGHGWPQANRARKGTLTSSRRAPPRPISWGSVTR